jgi:hypothetical protein
MARLKNLTVTETLRRAIAMAKFIEQTYSSGGKLLIEDQYGKLFTVNSK